MGGAIRVANGAAVDLQDVTHDVNMQYAEHGGGANLQVTAVRHAFIHDAEFGPVEVRFKSDVSSSSNSSSSSSSSSNGVP